LLWLFMRSSTATRLELGTISLLYAFMSVASGCVNDPSLTMNAQVLGDLQRIAVLDFTDAPGADAGYSGTVVASIVGQHVLGMDRWKLVERGRLDRILAEQDLQNSDITDPSTAVRIGRIAGADGIIIGEVAQYRIGSIPFFFFFVLDQDLYKVDCTFRLVSVETGEICLSAHASGNSLVSFEDAIATGMTRLFDQIQKAILSSDSQTSLPSDTEHSHHSVRPLTQKAAK